MYMCESQVGFATMALRAGEAGTDKDKDDVASEPLSS
jgi:hypothetical protein